ncbi:MAG: hypothetical protein NTY45_00080, partial [Elusimicrobia bacterium]|nr:hypothetical protein [Elusimicrobiota bacterium]
FFYAEKRFSFLRARTLDTYEYHLRRIVELSLKSGLTPILTTVPTNIADIDPGLFQQPDLSAAQMRAVLAKGQALEDSGRAAAAVPYYTEQAGAHPGMRAYLTYRIGGCYRALGRYESAARSYREAVDLGALDNFNRATSVQNDFIRGLARRYSVPLVDAVSLFEASSPHGLVGSGLFSDGHHPNLGGYILLTAAYAEKISERFQEPLLKRFSGPEDVYRTFSYGRHKQANALVTSGRWLFNVSVRHVWPAQRLKMALACFRKAVFLEPENFSAWLALGLTEAAMHSELLSDEKNIEWLGELGLGWFHRGEYSLSRAQQVEVLKKLSSYGVPAEVILKVSRLVEEHTRRKPETLMQICMRLAALNNKEEALSACQSAAYADSSGAGDGAFTAWDASLESYKLLKALGRAEEARETLLWAIRTAPLSWPRLSEARGMEIAGAK